MNRKLQKGAPREYTTENNSMDFVLYLYRLILGVLIVLSSAHNSSKATLDCMRRSPDLRPKWAANTEDTWG